MTGQRTTSLLAAGVVCLLAACTWENPDHPEITGVGRPIYYGSPDTNPAVVAITNGPGYGYFCSGTLITPTVVRTAAHCVDSGNTSSIQIFFGNEVGGPGDYIPTTEVVYHSQYDSYSITNDIALIRLAQPAPANITPIPALPVSLALTAADEGGTIEISGFGQTETGSSGDKLHIDVPLSKVCPGPSSCSFSPGGHCVPKSIGYPRTSGGTCYGDSGGPAFMVRGGVTYVVGVTSYGDGPCTQYGVSTKVDSFADFINDFIGNGATPEDCDTPGDEDGDGVSECDDSDCALHPDCIGPDACVQAGPIGCGDQVTATTVGETAQFLDYNTLTQSQETGPEVAYELTAPAGSQVSVSLTINGSGDLDLFLLPPANTDSCDPMAVMESSTNSDTNPENLSFSMPATGAFLVVDTWNTASPFTLEVTCTGVNPTPEDCTNGLDDDADGDVDCDDPDCSSHPDCQVTLDPEDCENGLDDDGDGALDCADADCASHPACISGQEDCTNQTDDDSDGAVDCQDPDCASHPSCQSSSEDCTNQADDDGDGAIDCADMDCAGHPACQGGGEDCTNQADDDGDGAIDCADMDCAGHAACISGLEDCTNDQDDDGDLAVDCEDPDCHTAPECAGSEGLRPYSSGLACNQGGSDGIPALPFFLLIAGLLVLTGQRRVGRRSASS